MCRKRISSFEDEWVFVCDASESWRNLKSFPKVDSQDAEMRKDEQATNWALSQRGECKTHSAGCLRQPGEIDTGETPGGFASFLMRFLSERPSRRSSHLTRRETQQFPQVKRYHAYPYLWLYVFQAIAIII